MNVPFNQAKAELFKLSSAAKDLSVKAVGILWFPKVTKGGIGIGGEIGEGALQVDGKTVAYYNTAAASIGFIFSNKGLMYNLTFDGSKITKIDK